VRGVVLFGYGRATPAFHRLAETQPERKAQEPRMAPPMSAARYVALASETSAEWIF
jgi:hypothetical protein